MVIPKVYTEGPWLVFEWAYELKKLVLSESHPDSNLNKDWIQKEVTSQLNPGSFSVYTTQRSFGMIKVRERNSMWNPKGENDAQYPRLADSRENEQNWTELKKQWFALPLILLDL